MKRKFILILITTMASLNSQQGSAQNVQMNPVLSMHYDELLETEKEVQSYTGPEDRLYIVSGRRYEYFLRAISPKAREKWDKQWLTNPDHKKMFQQKYDEIAAEAAKKMSMFVPSNEYTASHNAAEEGMMKSKLKNLATLKIHKIGLRHSTWQISKDDYGKIDARYKQGYIWARDSSDDHEFCHLYQVNIKQDYAGGGSYGDSYAVLIDDSLRGCPK